MKVNALLPQFMYIYIYNIYFFIVYFLNMFLSLFLLIFSSFSFCSSSNSYLQYDSSFSFLNSSHNSPLFRLLLLTTVMWMKGQMNGQNDGSIDGQRVDRLTVEPKTVKHAQPSWLNLHVFYDRFGDNVEDEVRAMIVMLVMVLLVFFGVHWCVLVWCKRVNRPLVLTIEQWKIL